MLYAAASGEASEPSASRFFPLILKLFWIVSCEHREVSTLFA